MFQDRYSQISIVWVKPRVCRHQHRCQKQGPRQGYLTLPLFAHPKALCNDVTLRAAVIDAVQGIPCLCIEQQIALSSLSTTVEVLTLPHTIETSGWNLQKQGVLVLLGPKTP